MRESTWIYIVSYGLCLLAFFQWAMVGTLDKDYFILSLLVILIARDQEQREEDGDDTGD